ncbi:START domain-containing protein [Bdellovibrionota bacterium FG-2]
MNIRIGLVLGFVLLLASGAGAAGVGANDGWEEVDSYSGVTIYRKEVAGTPVLAYKGVGVLNAPIGKLLSVAVDTSRKPEWMARLRSAKIVTQVSATERVEYIHVKSPWPLKDRDFVYRATLATNVVAKTITIRIASIEEPLCPVTDACIRAHLYSGTFVFTPVENGTKTRIEAEGHADLKGLIPKWIVNLYQKRIPRQSIEGVMRQVQKPGILDHPAAGLVLAAPKS